MATPISVNANPPIAPAILPSPERLVHAYDAPRSALKDDPNVSMPRMNAGRPIARGFSIEVPSSHLQKGMPVGSKSPCIERSVTEISTRGERVGSPGIRFDEGDVLLWDTAFEFGVATIHSNVDAE